MPIKLEPLDELLSGYEKPEDLLGEDGLFKQLKKALLERALGAELTHHLGYEKGDPAGRGTGNNRNGSYPKTVLTEDGAVDIEVPRDRNGSFEPQIVAKGESRLDEPQPADGRRAPPPASPGRSQDRREERPTPCSRDNRITFSRRLKDKTSTHRARPPRLLGMTPIDAGEKIAKLCRRAGPGRACGPRNRAPGRGRRPCS
jgi:putative transposase